MVDTVSQRTAAAALSLVALVAMGCNREETPVVDLSELARRQVLRVETALEFRADERALGLFGDGWSIPETTGDGLTFSWVVGRRAEVILPILGTEPRWLHLRCRPFHWPEAEAQVVRVRVNGIPVGDLELLPGFRPYTFALPDDVLVIGDNSVELTFSRASRPSEHFADSRDARLLAAAFDYLVLSSRPDFAPPDAGTAAVHRVEDGDVLQPTRTELAFPVTVPADGALAFELVGPETGIDGSAVASLAEARIVARRPGMADVELFRSAVGTGTGGERRLALAEFVGERVELVLQALAIDKNGRVRWRRPRLMGAAPPLDLATNVVLIVVDTLRADALGCYGGEVPTPNIDALAASGVRFARAYAHAPMTGPSHASMFTSLLPTEHGVKNNVQVLHQRHVTLAELLRDAYRRTAGFVSLGVLNTAFGTAQGFDRYDDVRGKDWWRTADAVNAGVLPWLSRQRDTPFFLWAHYSDPHEPYTAPGRSYPSIRAVGPQGATLTFAADAATAVLPVDVPPGTHELGLSAGVPAPERGLVLRGVRATAEGVSVGCGTGCVAVDRDNAMTEYEVRLPASLRLANDTGSAIATEIWLRAQEERDRDVVRDLYLEEVAYVDAEVGRLLDALRSAGRMNDTLIVFTSDHGEGLGDHDLLGHVHQLYDTLLRVPLIVAFPGRLPAGRVVETPVGHVDLLPTVVDLLGLPDTVQRTGRSLLPILESGGGGGSGEPVFSETWRPEAWHDRQSVVDGGRKLIRTLSQTTFVELYDLRADPAESDNLGSESEEARRLLGLLDVRMEQARLRSVIAEDGELSEDDLERLRALGYVR